MTDAWKSYSWIEEEHAHWQRAGLQRTLTERSSSQAVEIVVRGKRLINFGSNDYLQLASDPYLSSAVEEALKKQGWGGGASPWVTGYSTLHGKLEKALAEFEKTESALLFSSGYAANIGVIPVLIASGDVVYCDSGNHASLWDGCRLSRGDVRVYPHGNAAELRRLLEKSYSYRRRLIVTDSLFSMDGDFAPLEELAELAAKHDCMMLIDEAHAGGVWGQSGTGIWEEKKLDHLPILRNSTLSKAFGSIGGFFSGPRNICEWIRQKARSYVFSTAMPAAAAAAALAALQIINAEPERRHRLIELSSWMRKELAADGWDTGLSESQIIPLYVGSPQRAVEYSSLLREKGFLVPGIRPPTVPEGKSLLRISLTSGHTSSHCQTLLEVMRSLRH